MTNREPLAIRGALVAVAAVLVQLAVAFGVDLTVEQLAAVSATINVISAAAFGAFCWSGVAGGLWLRDSKEQPDEPGRK